MEIVLQCVSFEFLVTTFQIFHFFNEIKNSLILNNHFTQFEHGFYNKDSSEAFDYVLNKVS
jgi:hypothetical protein